MPISVREQARWPEGTPGGLGGQWRPMYLLDSAAALLVGVGSVLERTPGSRVQRERRNEMIRNANRIAQSMRNWRGMSSANQQQQMRDILTRAVVAPLRTLGDDSMLGPDDGTAGGGRVRLFSRARPLGDALRVARADNAVPAERGERSAAMSPTGRMRNLRSMEDDTLIATAERLAGSDHLEGIAAVNDELARRGMHEHRVGDSGDSGAVADRIAGVNQERSDQAVEVYDGTQELRPGDQLYEARGTGYWTFEGLTPAGRLRFATGGGSVTTASGRWGNRTQAYVHDSSRLRGRRIRRASTGPTDGGGGELRGGGNTMWWYQRAQAGDRILRTADQVEGTVVMRDVDRLSVRWDDDFEAEYDLNNTVHIEGLRTLMAPVEPSGQDRLGHDPRNVGGWQVGDVFTIEDEEGERGRHEGPWRVLSVDDEGYASTQIWSRTRQEWSSNLMNRVPTARSASGHFVLVRDPDPRSRADRTVRSNLHTVSMGDQLVVENLSTSALGPNGGTVTARDGDGVTVRWDDGYVNTWSWTELTDRMGQPENTFVFYAGSEEAQSLEWRDGRAYLNGERLDGGELLEVTPRSGNTYRATVDTSQDEAGWLHVRNSRGMSRHIGRPSTRFRRLPGFSENEVVTVTAAHRATSGHRWAVGDEARVDDPTIDMDGEVEVIVDDTPSYASYVNAAAIAGESSASTALRDGHGTPVHRGDDVEVALGASTGYTTARVVAHDRATVTVEDVDGNRYEMTVADFQDRTGPGWDVRAPNRLDSVGGQTTRLSRDEFLASLDPDLVDPRSSHDLARRVLAEYDNQMHSGLPAGSRLEVRTPDSGAYSRIVLVRPDQRRQETTFAHVRYRSRGRPNQISFSHGSDELLDGGGLTRGQFRNRPAGARHYLFTVSDATAAAETLHRSAVGATRRVPAADRSREARRGTGERPLPGMVGRIREGTQYQDTPWGTLDPCGDGETRAIGIENEITSISFGEVRTALRRKGLPVDNRDHWSAKNFAAFLVTQDGSLDYGDPEIKFPPIVLDEDGKRIYKDAVQGVWDAGGRAGRQRDYGIHCHVDADDINREKRKVLGQSYINNWGLIQEMIATNRAGARYAGYDAPNTEWGHHGIVGDEHEDYPEVSLNYGKRTVEFRRLGSNMRSGEILAWAEFCRQLVNWQKTHSEAMPTKQSLLALLDALGVSDEAKEVLLRRADRIANPPEE